MYGVWGRIESDSKYCMIGCRQQSKCRNTKERSIHGRSDSRTPVTGRLAMSCMQYFLNLQIRVFVQKISVFTRVQKQWDTQGMEYPKIPLKLHLKYGAPGFIQVLQYFGNLTYQLRALVFIRKYL